MCLTDVANVPLASTAEAGKWERRVAGGIAGYALKQGVKKGLQSKAARGFAKGVGEGIAKRAVTAGMKGLLKSQ